MTQVLCKDIDHEKILFGKRISSVDCTVYWLCLHQ